MTDQHNHLPHPENIRLNNFPTKEIKQRVMKETTSIIKIYEEVVAPQMLPQALPIMPLARELPILVKHLTNKLAKLT